MEEKMKEMTQEEIDAIQEQIPEWKRNAVVLQEDEPEEEKAKGIFGRAKAAAGDRIRSTTAVQNMMQSEEYKQLKDLREDYKSFRADVKE